MTDHGKGPPQGAPLDPATIIGHANDRRRHDAVAPALWELCEAWQGAISSGVAGLRDGRVPGVVAALVEVSPAVAEDLLAAVGQVAEDMGTRFPHVDTTARLVRRGATAYVLLEASPT